MGRRFSNGKFFNIIAFFLICAGASSALAVNDSCPVLLGPDIDLAWVKARMAHDDNLSAETKLLRQAVQNDGMRSVTLNRDILRQHNENYTVVLSEGIPTNQNQSGRCWIFAALNALRSTLIGEGKVSRDFEFSQTYLHFFNMLEKSNTFLEDSIGDLTKHSSNKILQRNTASRLKGFGDGGWYEYFAFLVAKYGLVPKDAMQESMSSTNTTSLNLELQNYLASSEVELKSLAKQLRSEGTDPGSPEGQAKLRTLKLEKMNGVWNIIATHLGTPPTEFSYRINVKSEEKDGKTVVTSEEKKFTPLTFATEFARYNPRDYVTVVDSPFEKLGDVYEIESSAIGKAGDGQPKYNIRFLNLTATDMENLVMKSIDGGQPVWFASDVMKDFDPTRGILHPGLFQRSAMYAHEGKEAPEDLTRKQRIGLQLLEPTHGMSLIGYDRPDPKAPPVKFLDENSWGPRRDKNGNVVAPNGNLHVYREWFEQNVFVIIVHRKFLEEELQKKWDGQAKMITRSAFFN